MRYTIGNAARVLVAMTAAAGSGMAAAQQQAIQDQLEAVTITAARIAVGEVGSEQVGSVVTRDDMRRFNRDNIGDALNLLPGVTMSTNARNEKLVSVRGFDARGVPLFIDGIPVYIPYDGYVDFNRFTTADIETIQVAKGFSSMEYGPNTLGGAINLISRKPRRGLEGDATIGVGAEGERQASVNLGTRQGIWYLQVGASYLESDAFRLASDFVPTATEDGGARNNAWRKDDKLSFKVGLTPANGDEYAFGYYKQQGEKGQPPSTVPTGVRYWKWPYWDKESAYFTSRTALGGLETLKVRLYHDRFDNEINSFTDGSYTVLKTSGQGSVGTGRSIYDDTNRGGSAVLESRRLAGHTLRLSAHYREDEHEERDGNAVTGAVFEDTLSSWALEDNVRLAPDTTLSLGAGRHRLRPEKVFSAGNPYSLPDSQHASNAQAGLFHDLSPTTRLYATVARKTRLPTLKDRYSQRLGTFIENPGLRAERSLNLELGYQGRPWQGALAEAAVFASDITDKIQTVANVSGVRSQMQNVGEARIRGVELGLSTPLGSRLEVGGNYTWLDLDNEGDPGIRLTDVPRQKLVAHALLRVHDAVDLTAFVEHNSSRWVSNTLELGGFTVVNLKAAWRPLANTTLEAGLNNAFDRNYALADGFPSAGRMWFANARYTF